MTTSADRRQATRPLSSATKLLRLIDAVAAAPAPVHVSTLAAQVGSTRAAVHQQLVTLVQAGWVEQLADRSYRLTLHAARVGQAALEQAGIGQRVLPAMESLAQDVQEAVSLAVLDAGTAHIIERAAPRRAVSVDTRWEAHMPIRRSASGQVLVAYASEHQLAQLEDLGLDLPTDSERKAVRRAAFALSVGDWPDDVRAVAVPLFALSGGCVAALSIAAPSARFEGERFAAILRERAWNINAELAGVS